jgi:hypothetical protein
VNKNYSEIDRPSQNPWWNRSWVFSLFVIVATLIAYLPVWHAGFIWDDVVLLTANPLIHASNGWYHF